MIPDIPDTSQRSLNTSATEFAAPIWQWVLFFALLLWYTSGAIPFGGPQCDAIREAAGIEHLARYGWEPLLTHDFIGCPGLTITLLALRKLTGLDPLMLQGVLSSVSGLVFITASAGLIHRLCGIATPIAGLAMLLSPVAIVAGMYPNDLVTAAALAAVALYLFAGSGDIRSQIVGAICLGLAGWFRADAILITGAIPFIMYRSSKPLFMCKLVIVGGIAATIAFVGVYASGSSIGQIVTHARDVTDTESPVAQVIGFYISFFPLLVIYGTVLGIVHLKRAKQWRLIAIVAAGTVPLWIIHVRYSLPKYFTYVVPWFALVICCAAMGLKDAPRQRKRLHASIAAALFVAQYTLGLQVTLRDKPWRTPPKAVLCTLLDHEFAHGRVNRLAIVVGAGTMNPLGHAGTPMSGILFSPLVMQREQRTSREYLNECIQYVAGLEDKELRFFAKTYDGKSSAMVALIANGYRCTSVVPFGPQPLSQRFIWERGDQRVILYRLYIRGCNMKFLREIGELEGTYFAGSGAEEHAVLQQVTSAKQIVRTQAMRVRAIYEVTFPPLDDADSNGAATAPGSLPPAHLHR